MTHLKNAFVDLADWPELDEIQLVPLLSAYAKARALVWGVVTVVVGLAFSGPLVAIAIWGDNAPPRVLWVDTSALDFVARPEELPVLRDAILTPRKPGVHHIKAKA